LWRREYSIGFGGAPNPQLDQICNSDDRISAILEVAKRALAALVNNPIIPKDELNRAEVGGDFHWTSDGSAAGAIELGSAFIDLLESSK
jgi:hypothetical protein